MSENYSKMKNPRRKYDGYKKYVACGQVKLNSLDGIEL